MVIPPRHSAACCTTDPIKVTGAVAPASGMETISAGTPARASCTKFSLANSDQFKGGDGQTSKIARGILRFKVPPESAARRVSMAFNVGALNAPVITGLFEYDNTRKSR